VLNNGLRIHDGSSVEVVELGLLERSVDNKLILLNHLRQERRAGLKSNKKLCSCGRTVFLYFSALSEPFK
jgi:hypothetical protein